MAQLSPSAPVDRVEWESFLARHDLVWDVLPREYREAPFLGDGASGSLIYYDSGSDAMKIEVYRSDVHDHRDSTDGWTAYSRPRFVIGNFLLHTAGRISSGGMHLDLWNAELRCTLNTDNGSVSFTHYIHASNEIMIFDFDINGAESVRWSWHPGEALTTRPGVPRTKEDISVFAERYGDHYRDTLRIFEPNSSPEMHRRDDIDLCIQNLSAGGQYVTAWRTLAGSATTMITICNSYPKRNAVDNAISILDSAAKSTSGDLVSSHRSWWHSYYPASFLSIPDAKMESFYWIQMYKLACATRADRPMMDTSGPWFQPTPWPYITTDLNLQLCYWPVCTSNRLELGDSLVRGLSRGTDALIENVRPEKWQSDSAYMHITCAQDLIGPRDDDMRYWNCVGNLPWTLHNVWMLWRYSMNDSILETLLPLLERAVNFYLHLAEEDENGTLHLSPTYSPEYPVNPNRDCHYDLALFRWGCQTLLDINERLAINHPKEAVWRDVLERLVDYAVDEKGVRIGADQGFTAGHRHFSHLLMIYPLYELNVETPDVADLVKSSVETWINSGALAGYSFTGASSMSSAVGDGNAALEYLRGLNPRIEPNTLYLEAGPCMETPLAAAQSMHDMLIQSWGGTIRVFPAVADEWQEVVFHRLLAEGGFRVSARRSGGKTVWVYIESTVGEPCRIRVDIEDPECRINGSLVAIDTPNVFEIPLKAGESVLVRNRASSDPITIEPLITNETDYNFYGLRNDEGERSSK